MSSFIHLHLHTEYSLLDGICRIDEVFQKAKEYKMPAVAITDHGALYGAFKFYLKGLEYGIKPIIGCEVYKAKGSRFDKSPENKRYHLILLAKNLTGYKNLMRIVSLGFLEGFYYKPRVDFELLKKYHQGLIVLSACMSGEIPKLILENQPKQAEGALKRYLDIFGDDFYIEIQRHNKIKELKGLNKSLIALSRKYGVPLVATNDVHYLNPDDAYAQEIVLCIQTQRTIFEKNRPLSMIKVPDFYFKSQEEMKALFLDLPEAIENTQKIVDKCNLKIPYGSWILPKFETPNNEDPNDYLRHLVKLKKKRIKGYPKETIDKRLEYELNIIINKGYGTYFLIVQDFVNWSKAHDVGVGPGRGSVAGSLVAYSLGITDINPLEHNLPFERFLNPDRPTPPDIDIDFADVKRAEVIHYVTEKYGKDKVAQIITFGKMESRMAIRDVARALGLSYSKGDRIAKMIPAPKQGFQMSIAQALEESPTLKYAYESEPETKKVIDISQRLEGLSRHSSVHAAGVIISEKDLLENVPLQRESREGRIITQYDMYCLDLNAVSNNKAVGLLKVDFLGLRNLSIIDQALKYVEKTSGKKIDIHDVPTDDKKTYKLIYSGNTVGVFQLESYGMRHLAKELKPNKMSDITAMVALYRPGPMALIPAFLEGKKNPKKIRYLHKDLKPILEETYGVLVYQEQVMSIAHDLAGFTMSEADKLRMAMGKKKKSLMKKEKIKFITGAVKKGYTEKLAKRIFDFIEKFAAYGFNKPHSASYALIAYWTAHIKANYPVEFMTALLTGALQGVAGPMREIKMTQIIQECRRMKIKILSPDINKSKEDFSIEKDSIRFGLSAIKNVGSAAIESIIEERKKGSFGGFRDFLFKVDLRRVNKKTVESLIKAGAFSRFGNRATLLSNYPEIVKKIISLKKQMTQGQFGLFSDISTSQFLKDDFKKIDELPEGEIIDMEKEIVGFSLSSSPLAKITDKINQRISKKIGELSTSDINKSVILAGVINRKKVVNTKKGNKAMAFANLYDETGAVELTIFPRTFARFKNVLLLNQLVLLRGKVNEREERLNIIVDTVIKV